MTKEVDKLERNKTYCRCCYQEISKSSCNSIKITEKMKNQRISILSMLQKCTGLNFNLFDETTKHSIVCQNCVKQLLAAYEFRETVIETNKKFKVIQTKVELDVKMELQETEHVIWDSDDRKRISAENKEKKIVKSEMTSLESIELQRKCSPNFEGYYDCPEPDCCSIFKKLGQLKLHLEEKHSNHLISSCEVCGNEYESLRDLKKHVRDVHIPKPFVCDLCLKRFSTLQYLRSHIKSFHLGVKQSRMQAICTICSKIFASTQKMTRHRKEVHFKETIQKLFECSVCGIHCITNSALNQHKLTHSNLRNFICDLCPKTFKIKGHLTTHFKTVHLASRDFRCEKCGLAYKCNRGLKLHIQTAHSDKMPFQCNFCDQKFKTKDIRRAHEKNLHIGGPVNCLVCSKTMKTPHSLNIHMKTIHLHENQPCPHCKNILKNSKSLKDHIRKMHAGIKARYECLLCSVNMWKRHLVVQHVLEVHAMESGKTAEQYVKRYKTIDPTADYIFKNNKKVMQKEL